MPAPDNRQPALPSQKPAGVAARRSAKRRNWWVVFLVSSVTGGILLVVAAHLDNASGSIDAGGSSQPGSTVGSVGAVLVLVALVIAAVWLLRVFDRHVVTPLEREIDIAIGPLPPVEVLRHPDGSPLTPEEQALARWQLAQRQAQARKGLAALGLLLWLGHHHGENTGGHQ